MTARSPPARPDRSTTSPSVAGIIPRWSPGSEARGADYRVNEVEAIGLKQLFTLDPNGVLLELNFFAG